MGKVVVYGLVAAILFVIVFVRSGEISGTSGGAQASQIIRESAGGLGKLINAAQGYKV